MNSEFVYRPYPINRLKSITTNLKEAVRDIDLLQHTYQKTDILIADTPYTLVPREYFNEQGMREIYIQNFPQLTNQEIVLYNSVADGQAMLLYSIEKTLHTFIHEQFAQASLYCSMSSIINYATYKSAAQNRRFCMAYLHAKDIEMLCMEDGTIRFNNTFTHRETSDALYFILNCWQQLDLSQEEDTLTIAGHARDEKLMVNELKNFIRNVHRVRATEEINTHDLARVEEMPFDLQTHIACE